VSGFLGGIEMNLHAGMTRRQMLRISAGSLLGAGIWPGTIWADGTKSGNFSFIVVNDLHYLDKQCRPWFENMVRRMRSEAGNQEPAGRSQETGSRTQQAGDRSGHWPLTSHHADFCLVVGDLAEHGSAEQLGSVREILSTLKLPVHVVIGNHDYSAQNERKPFEDLFPKSLNYHFEHGGWQFVGLDSSDGRKPMVAVQPETLRWLDRTLPKLDKRAPTVVFTHFPLGPWVVYRATNADQVLERFKEFNLVAVYNGHFHGFTERHEGQTTLTTNRCCSFRRNNHDRTKEKGYFLCHAKEGKIERKFIEVKGV
jgi:hypothetical protein